MACASHREREDKRDEKNANRIVPIEKFETVALDAFIRVGPRPPADGAGNHHQQRNGQTRWREQSVLLVIVNVRAGKGVTVLLPVSRHKYLRGPGHSGDLLCYARAAHLFDRHRYCV